MLLSSSFLKMWKCGSVFHVCVILIIQFVLVLCSVCDQQRGVLIRGSISFLCATHPETFIFLIYWELVISLTMDSWASGTVAENQMPVKHLISNMFECKLKQCKVNNLKKPKQETGWPTTSDLTKKRTIMCFNPPHDDHYFHMEV